MKRLCWLIGLLVLATGSVAGADLIVWVEHSAMKVRPFAPPKTASTAHLYSAKNEWEATQVVLVDSDGGALTGCDVTVDPLSGPGDDIEGIDLFREHYVLIDKPSYKPVDPAKVGYWPDAMIPFKDAYYGEDRAGAPFDVPEGWNQPIWIEIFTPEDQDPGDYDTLITVTCGPKQTVQIPLTLTVWDFALPSSITLPSSYGYSCGTVYNIHQAMGGTVDRDELTTNYYKEALRHRMMFAWGHCWGPSDWNYDPGTQTGTLDWIDFDTLMGPVLDGTLDTPGASFDTYTLPGRNKSDPEQIAYWRAWAEHFKAKGWFDKLFLYLPDEPTPDEYPWLVEIADLLHQADPDLKAMATEQVTDGLKGAVDIWCPDEPLFSDSFPWPPFPEDYAPRQALGEKVWWYNCMSAQFVMDFSSHFVDAPAMSMRIWPWLTRRYNFEGLLFWSAVWLYAQVPDIWEDVYAQQFFCNGDGQMYYPGVVSKIGGTHDIPVPSLRLKQYREGMEDYEYFAILDNMKQEAFVQAEVEARAFRSWDWEHDPVKLEQSRHRIAGMILGTLDTDPPASPTGLFATGGFESVTIAWEANAEPDLAGYEVSLARYPGERIVEATVDAQTLESQFTGLEIGKPYYLSVRAFDETQNRGAWAPEVSAAPTEGTDDDDDDNDAADDDDDSDDDDNDDTADDDQGGDDDDDDNDDGGCCG